MNTQKSERRVIKHELTKKYITVVSMPILTGILVLLFWRYVLYENGIFFSEKAENPILFMIIPVVAFIYVIFASIAVNSVFDKYKTIMRSVVKTDTETFLLHRDQRLPGLLHVLVGAPSVILISLTTLYNYKDLYIGGVAVFAVAYVVAQTWFIITELDNFHTRRHFKAKTPQHWHETDTKEFFKAKAKA